MKTFKRNLLSLIILISICIGVAAQSKDSVKISQKELIEDFRQLVNFLEKTHPDPYLYGGGKIAFHKRVHKTISEIPNRGMTKEEFYWYLRPFIASIGDSHTDIEWRPHNFNWKQPNGIPIVFGVADTSLYVKAVFDSTQRELLGCKLNRVENVSIEELRNRMSQMIGFQNKYRALNKLAGWGGYLWRGYLLKGLVPEWKNESTITISLSKPDNTEIDFIFKLPVTVNQKSFWTESKIDIPSLDSSYFNSGFIDDKTAILAIASPAFSREIFEKDYVSGYDIKEYASEFYERYNKKEAPEEIEEILVGLPSATEHFIELITQMKRKKTKTLIIDLRQYSGGGFAINHMLLYFLYGKEKLEEIVPNSRWVEKLSDIYFARYSKQNISLINERAGIKLNKSDFFFDEDICGWSESDSVFDKYIFADFEKKYKMLSTFWKYYKDSSYDNYYSIPNIVVICSDNTFSGGYEMLVSQYFAGSKILGTPTGQDANHFGDTLPFELTNSKLNGWLSHSWFEYFPENPPVGNVLMPDYILDYGKLKEYNFDSNAEILYSIDLFGK